MTGGNDEVVDHAVGRLRALLPDAGALDPPTDTSTLDEVVAAVAPFRLPASVERFWRLAGCNGWAGPVFPFPGPCGPDFALESWRSHREQPGMVPDLLFPVCYQSHGFVLVELDGPHGDGGACFTWGYALEPFVLVAADLADYLEVVADTVDRGVSTDDAAVRDALAERLRSSPDPRYGAAAEIGHDPPDWPRHWRESGVATATSQELLGATTTLAELASGRAASGRVHAIVVELWGSGEGRRVVLDDGTGALAVWCPAPVTAYGPIHGRRFEIDLVVRGDLPHGAGAEAHAVRRLDG